MLDDLTFMDALGVLGSLFLVVAYHGISIGRFQADQVGYQAMNLAGSALLLISLYFRPNPGAILIEVLWAAIALLALTRIFRRRE